MLGIRHYKGVAVDLYVGDPATFVCDEQHRCEKVPLEIRFGPHTGLVSDHGSLIEQMTDLKRLLDQLPEGKIRRITWILPDRARYDEARQALSSLFPEKPFHD